MSGEFSGSLRERVSIEQRRDERDVLAGRQRGYRYDGMAWAAVTPLAPADQTEADALSSLPRWGVTLRSRDGIGPDTRLVWRGRFLLVRAILSDPRDGSKMTLTCEEVR